MNDWRVPFNRPSLVGGEIEGMQAAVREGHLSGGGRFTRRCEALLMAALGVPRALLTTSCTHALEMAGMLLDLRPGDEVIVPSFTFVSTANAFSLRGARPVFADVRPDTLNLDEERLEALVTASTRAIVPVHYAGVACEMDAILEVAHAHGVAVVEDNSHGLFGRYRGRPLGALGDMASLSFHDTKNFTCGEGGALLLNRPELEPRAEVLREKGTDRSRFFRGEVDRYTWVDTGSSYVPAELLAAFLLAQLKARDRIQAARRGVWEGYAARLARWAEREGVGLPGVPPHCQQAYHMFYLLLPSEERRRRLIDRLQAAGICAVFHYTPLHLSAMGRQYGGRPGACPVTEDVSDRLLRLPFYNGLGDDDLDFVAEQIVAAG